MSVPLMKKNRKQHHKQVRKAAIKLVKLIKNGANCAVCLAPMQSGKTELIECAFQMLRRDFLNCMGLYVTAHGHLDFISQNFERLEHLEAIDLYCLGLRERRKSMIKNRPLASFKNDPIFVFFDENHFGDGAIQTIFAWLTVNKLYPARSVVLVGVSATPFSSVDRAGKAVVRFDFGDMPTYKSVSKMLANDQVIESTPMVIRDCGERRFDNKNPAFLHLNRLVGSGAGGYAIIRLCNRDSLLFSEELKRIHGDKVHIRHWNQGNQIHSVGNFFSQWRDSFVVVIVQHKARMGNTIPTEHIRLVYEYSPKASVATVAQGLLGRCCGHGKLNHDVTVYTQIRQATAYSLFERGHQQAFLDYLSKHNLKASQRSVVESAELEVLSGSIDGAPGFKRTEIIDAVKTELKRSHDVTLSPTSIIVRRHTTNRKDRKRYVQTIEAGSNPALTKPERAPGRLSIYFDNRKDRNGIYFAFRTDVTVVKGALVASEDSFYSNI